MIFVTVGTDQPFDRMIRAVDAWAGRTGTKDLFAQIGYTKLRPSFIKYVTFLEPPDYRRQFAAASVIVSHAGMGTILTALSHRKPIVVMPRQAAFGEQRNDHQLATARHLLQLGKIEVAFDDAELTARLDSLAAFASRGVIGPYASLSLTTALHQFIHQTGEFAPPRQKTTPADPRPAAGNRSS